MVYFTSLAAKYHPAWIRLKRKVLAHIFLVRLIIVLIILAILLGFMVVLYSLFAAKIGNIANSIRLGYLFISGNSSLIDQYNGRTNILIMGTGGAGHEAPDLTDTMLLLSLDHTGKKPAMLSLPRDLWIPSLEAKLNTAYYYGNQKRKGGGLVLAKSSVFEVIGQPVHYAIVVDFGGFKQFVDLLGGVEVDVERTFDDYKYPVPGKENDLCGNDLEFKCRYEHVRFEQGKQILNGEQALKFVRSRNAKGEEGTDFARSVRQQKILVAIRRSVLSPAVILNPGKLQNLWRNVDWSIQRDMSIEELILVGRLFLRLDRDRLNAVVLDGGTPGDAQNGLLIHPAASAQYKNQWVLIPRDATLLEIHRWVENLLAL